MCWVRSSENSLIELRARWGNQDLRRVANEVLVDAARQVKVLRALSLGLVPVRSELPPPPPVPEKSSARGATAKVKPRPSREVEETEEEEEEEEDRAGA